MDQRALVNEGSAMRVLDLFSGIGGFSLGLERAGMETVAFCEYDEKARRVLSKHWPDVPQYSDVRTLTKGQLDNDGITDIGLICGGYPCQPFSTAGKRQGEADDRALWPEYFRLIKEIRPTWVIAENVAGHISMGLDNVLADLESEDYAVQTFVIPACAVDAKHRRDRVWIIANNDSDGCYVDDEGQSGSKRQTLGSTKSLGEHRSSGDRESNQNSGRVQGARVDEQSRKENVAHTEKLQRDGGREHTQQSKRQVSKPRNNGSSINVADTMHQGLQGGAETGNTESSRKGREELPAGCGERSEPGNWLPEPPVGRVANGVPRRVDRLKQLGNAVVPQIPEMIGRAINDC